MNKEQFKGNARKAEGKIKEVAGKVTDDKSLELKGKLEQQVGKVQISYGDAKQDFKKVKKVSSKRSAKD